MKQAPSFNPDLESIQHILAVDSSSCHETKTEVDADLDGGIRAWMTVAGSWLVLFTTFGYLYSFGVYQDYYTRIFLNTHSPSSISWIGSFQLMMPFALGIVSGKLFDAGYFRSIMTCGSLIFTASLFMLSLAKPNQYYQVFLSQGVGMGLGIGLTFVPSTSVTVRHFQRHRALASGVALSGCSTGAVIFPIMLNHQIPTIGFARAVRATGYIAISFLFLGNCLMSMPLRQHGSQKSPNIKTFFRDPPYAWILLGALVSMFGLYFPVTYLQLYAVEHDVNNSLAFYSLAILNAASVIGRIVGNIGADIYGPWNFQVPCTFLTGVTIWAVLGIHDATSLLIVSILYGIFSGAWLSLSIAAVASLAERPEEVGARIGLVLALGSFGCLGSGPAQGALLTSDFLWIRPIAFSGTIMFISSIASATARMLVVRRKGSQRV